MPAMPLSLVDAADDARADLFVAWDVAAAVVDAVPGEAALEFEEFQWAWASVRSRAITFRVAQREGAGSGDGSGDESGNAAEGKVESERRVWRRTERRHVVDVIDERSRRGGASCPWWT